MNIMTLENSFLIAFYRSDSEYQLIWDYYILFSFLIAKIQVFRNDGFFNICR